MKRHLTLVRTRHLHLVPTCGDIGDNPEQPATYPGGDAA